MANVWLRREFRVLFFSSHSYRYFVFDTSSMLISLSLCLSLCSYQEGDWRDRRRKVHHWEQRAQGNSIMIVKIYNEYSDEQLACTFVYLVPRPLPRFSACNIIENIGVAWGRGYICLGVAFITTCIQNTHITCTLTYNMISTLYIHVHTHCSLSLPCQNAPHTMKVVTSSEWDFPYSREKAAFPLVS